MKYKFFKITAIITIIANILVLGMLLYFDHFVFTHNLKNQFFTYVPGNYSIFVLTIESVCKNSNEFINDSLYLIFIFAIIIRLIDYVSLLIFYREQNKYTNIKYNIKTKLLNVAGLLSLPFWCILIGYFPFRNNFLNHYQLHSEYFNLSNINHIFTVIMIGLVILIAIGTIIMDIMGLCYKSQEK